MTAKKTKPTKPAAKAPTKPVAKPVVKQSAQTAAKAIAKSPAKPVVKASAQTAAKVAPAPAAKSSKLVVPTKPAPVKQAAKPAAKPTVATSLKNDPFIRDRSKVPAAMSQVPHVTNKQATGMLQNISTLASVISGSSQAKPTPAREVKAPLLKVDIPVSRPGTISWKETMARMVAPIAAQFRK